MTEYSTVSARLATNLKSDAEQVLQTLGLSHSSAISALYSQIVLQQGFPFDLKIPAKKKPADLLSFWEIRSAVREVAKRYGAARVWLFGSYARGEAKDSSDIDLRIDKGDIKGLALGGFVYDLEQKLNVAVDVATTASLSDSFLSEIRDDEVLLYER